MTSKTLRSVKTLSTDWTNFVLIFQVILANMVLQLVLSRVAFPTDVTEMVDTFISGFFSQMNDIDVILQS